MVIGCSNKSVGRYSATSSAIGGGVILRTLDLNPDGTVAVTQSTNGQQPTLNATYSTKDDKIICTLARESGKETISWELKKEGEHLVLTHVQSTNYRHR
jgi:hypothetical protein